MRAVLSVSLFLLLSSAAQGILRAKQNTCLLFTIKKFSTEIRNEFVTYDVPCPAGMIDKLAETEALQPVANTEWYLVTTDYVENTGSVMVNSIPKGVLDGNPSVVQGELLPYGKGDCVECTGEHYSNGWTIFKCWDLVATGECPSPFLDGVRFRPPPPAELTGEGFLQYCYFTMQGGQDRFLCRTYFTYS